VPNAAVGDGALGGAATDAVKDQAVDMAKDKAAEERSRTTAGTESAASCMQVRLHVGAGGCAHCHARRRVAGAVAFPAFRRVA
jgi:hypothetical protein